MSKPKVLIFSLAYSPFWGGAEIAVKEITDRIPDVDFDMITKKFGNESDFEKIGSTNIYRISSSKILFPFRAYLKAKKLHKEKTYDIIWSVMANRAGFAASFLRRKFPQIKFLLTLQEGDPLDYPKKRMGGFYFFLRPLFKKIFTRADYIQTISNYLANWAHTMGAICPIEVIPNGVGFERYKDTKIPAPPEASQGGQKTNSGLTTLITTSRLVLKNGIADLIDATKILIDEGYNIKTLILGAGPLEKDLKLEIRNLKLENRVSLLGHIEPDKVPNYLKDADIFIRPSLSEGLGSSFLEAMAAGLPVIATPVGGIPDFLKDGQTGLFCQANNPKSIAEKIKEYINNPARTNKIIENAQKLVREKYDWNIISQKMKTIFFKLYESKLSAYK